MLFPPAHQTTAHATCCVDAVTEFCDSCHPQTRSSSDDVSFHVQAWTRRTAKQRFQSDFLVCRGAVTGTMRKTIDNRHSNTMTNFEERLRSSFRNRCKCLPWILCARVCPIFSVLNRNTNTTCSTSHDTGKTASPHCILFAGSRPCQRVLHVPTKIEHKHVTQTAQHRFATHTTSIALSRGETTSPTFSTCPFVPHGPDTSAASEPESHGAFWAVTSCSVPQS